MVLLFSLLILVPAVAWLAARHHRYQWSIVGTTFGVISYPFLAGISVPLLYLGFPIGFVGTAVMLMHRAPGHQIVVAIAGHKRLTGVEDVWVYVINAIVWAAFYGFIGY